MIQGIAKRLFRKGISKFFIPDIKFSYAQNGEDLILSYLFFELKILKPSYLDIGANHPRFISNTYFFYEHGSRGVCIEPNPILAKKIKAIRPADTVLNIGIGVNDQDQADFYQFPYKAHGLSTFSKKEADHWQQVGMEGLGKISYEKVIKIDLININNIISQHFPSGLDLLSIDVEGLDFEILSSLNFEKYKPKVICAETLAYKENKKGYKRNDIQSLLLGNGYELYGETRINTIFVLSELL